MGRHYSITLTDKIKERDNIRIRQKRSGFKKFALEIIQGWFPNIITKDAVHGVEKLRKIDKIKNKYHEYVKDLKDNKVIRM